MDTYVYCAAEMSYAALKDGNNIKAMGELLDEGFWKDPLMDHETYVPRLPLGS